MKAVYPFFYVAFVTVLPAQDRDAALRRGDQLDEQMQTRAALEAYQEALEIGPRDAEVLRKIAKQHAELIIDSPTKEAKLKAARKAVEYAEEAVVAPGNDADARVALAICYAKLGDLSDSRTKVALSRKIKELCEEALVKDPNHELAHHVLGRWHFEVSQMPGFVRGLVRLIYGAMPKASLKDAIRHLEIATRLNPNRVANQIEYGRALLVNGQTKEGRERINAGLRLPDSDRDDPETKERGRRALR